MGLFFTNKYVLFVILLYNIKSHNFIFLFVGFCIVNLYVIDISVLLCYNYVEIIELRAEFTCIKKYLLTYLHFFRF